MLLGAVWIQSHIYMSQTIIIYYVRCSSHCIMLGIYLRIIFHIKAVTQLKKMSCLQGNQINTSWSDLWVWVLASICFIPPQRNSDFYVQYRNSKLSKVKTIQEWTLCVVEIKYTHTVFSEQYHNPYFHVCVV